MKSVLISINPKWCELIASGEKTIEVRKTRPKIDTPFKCYIYCTKGKFPLLLPTYSSGNIEDSDIWKVGNGKVIGEFVCDEISMIAPICDFSADIDIEKETCLSRIEIVNYLKGKGYGWHISDLKIYDKPKELGEFKPCKPKMELIEKNDYIARFREVAHLRKAPQSWCYVESEEN